MPSLTLVFALASASAPPAVAIKPTLDRETAMRVRAFQEEQTFPLPSKKDIDEAEKAISKQACIGDLTKWHRRYMRAIDWTHGHIDHYLIRFSFREAGVYGYASGREVGRLTQMAELDDRQYRLASGVYNARTGVVTVDSCGLNWPNRPYKPDVR